MGISKQWQLVSYYDTIDSVGSRHIKTLTDIFDVPVRSNIQWSDIEKMLVAFGAEISEGSGSRVRIAINGVHAVFHRPHPRK